MRTHMQVVASLWLLGTMACGESPAPQQAAEVKAPGTTAGAHAEEENAIHLSEDMVRDLRISTALVAERSGAQEVSVLGEVAADQSRYAEVAPPTGGQIVGVLVELNAAVGRGTPLAQLRSTDLGRARADLLAADARRELAGQTLERKRTLAAERIVPHARCRRPRRRSARPTPRRGRRERRSVRSASPRTTPEATARCSTSAPRWPGVSLPGTSCWASTPTPTRRCSRSRTCRACG